MSYIIADRMGTPQLASNSSGTTVWQTTYQPFGTTGNVSASITQNLRLPGQYYDVETGFSYNLNRDQMPNLGRYVEADPIGLVGGTNAYAYVGGMPLSAIDPLGLWQFTLSGGAFFGAELTFGNNGGTGTGWESLFNGQWNLGADVGLGFGVNASLDTTNSGCDKPGGNVNLTESLSGDLRLPLSPVSASAGETITTASNGETTVEADADLGPEGADGSVGGSVGGAVTISSSGQKSFAPIFSVGTPASGFVGFGGNVLFGGPTGRESSGGAR
jgi:RHS repeat-associated protein